MVTFTPEAKESGRRTQVKVYLEGTDRSTDSMVFTCPAYEEKSLSKVYCMYVCGLLSYILHNYSETSVKGHFRNAATSFNRTPLLCPI